MSFDHYLCFLRNKKNERFVIYCYLNICGNCAIRRMGSLAGRLVPPARGLPYKVVYRDFTAPIKLDLISTLCYRLALYGINLAFYSRNNTGFVFLFKFVFWCKITTHELPMSTVLILHQNTQLNSN